MGLEIRGRKGRVGIAGKKLEPIDAKDGPQVEFNEEAKGPGAPGARGFYRQGGIAVVVKHLGKVGFEKPKGGDGRKDAAAALLRVDADQYVVRSIGLLRKDPMGAFNWSKVDDAAGRIGLINGRRVEDDERWNRPTATLPRQPTLAS